MAGGAGSGKAAALAVLSRRADPVAPTNEAPASVAAPLKNSRLSTKLFREGTGSFSLGMIVPAFLGRNSLFQICPLLENICHSERSEESLISFLCACIEERFLASLGMTGVTKFSLSSNEKGAGG
jgi:hypothetical protein